MNKKLKCFILLFTFIVQCPTMVAKDIEGVEQKYAEDLNSVINKSSLSEEDRELVRINSEILINSKLCWAANVNKIVKEN